MQKKESKKILVLCKRQYTGKDLLDDRYGRLREIPLGLARLGHDVRGVCLSYRKRTTGLYIDQSKSGDAQVNWHSINLGKFILPGIIQYTRKVKELISEFKPDIVLAMSDAFHIIYGCHVAKLAKAKFVVDLYDNFESFGGTKLPGVQNAFIRAVAKAEKVSCVSKPLTNYVSSNYRCEGDIWTIENGYDAKLFRPLDIKLCRERLGLPENARLIGTAGAISNSRDINTLFRAMEILGAKYRDLELVVAGPIGRKLVWPANVKSHNLGCLAHSEIPYVLNALNVAVIPNIESEFGKYCYPQKASEILACRVPVVAASVGTMKILFADRPDNLYLPGDSPQLSIRIEQLLNNPEETGIRLSEWKEIVERFNLMLVDNAIAPMG